MHPIFIVSLCMQAALALRFATFDQRLDHFDARNAHTFSQKYYVEDKFYKPGGAIFVDVGGEDELHVSPIVHYYSQQLNALILGLEHRFFGDSTPDRHEFTLTSYAFVYKYQSIKQAALDIVNFINEYKRDHLHLSNASVILFGCSYAGTLSALTRTQYGDRIDGAVASSAPMIAKFDNHVLLDAMARLYDRSAPGCADAIKIIFDQINDSLTSNDETKLQHLRTTIGVCTDDLRSIESKAVVNLLAFIPFLNIATFGECSDRGVECVCTKVMRSDINDALSRWQLLPHFRLADSFQFAIDWGLLDCIPTDVVLLKDILDIPSIAKVLKSSIYYFDLAWLSIGCKELGYFYTTDGANENTFGSGLRIEYAETFCDQLFGEENNRSQLIDVNNVVDVNDNDMDLFNSENSSKIIFVHNEFDPWSSLMTNKQACVHIFVQGSNRKWHEYFTYQTLITVLISLDLRQLTAKVCVKVVNRS